MTTDTTGEQQPSVHEEILAYAGGPGRASLRGRLRARGAADSRSRLGQVDDVRRVGDRGVGDGAVLADSAGLIGVGGRCDLIAPVQGAERLLDSRHPATDRPRAGAVGRPTVRSGKETSPPVDHSRHRWARGLREIHAPPTLPSGARPGIVPSRRLPLVHPDQPRTCRGAYALHADLGRGLTWSSVTWTTTGPSRPRRTSAAPRRGRPSAPVPAGRLHAKQSALRPCTERANPGGRVRGAVTS